MKTSSLVLLSGGLDSALSFIYALEETTILYALTFDYGQRSAQKEITSAKALCHHYHVDHKIVSLPFFKDLTWHPFFNTDIKCPEPDMENLDDKQTTTASAKAVWVPNRNGIFLNVAAAYAESGGIKNLYVGFNIEEASTFPDNSLEYTQAINHCLSFSTLNQVELKCPTISMKKNEIVKQLAEKNFPFHLLWSCYNNQNKMCGRCESCQRLKRALNQNDLQTLTIELFEK